MYNFIEGKNYNAVSDTVYTVRKYIENWTGAKEFIWCSWLVVIL